MYLRLTKKGYLKCPYTGVVLKGTNIVEVELSSPFLTTRTAGGQIEKLDENHPDVQAYLEEKSNPKAKETEPEKEPKVEVVEVFNYEKLANLDIEIVCAATAKDIKKVIAGNFGVEITKNLSKDDLKSALNELVKEKVEDIDYIFEKDMTLSKDELTKLDNRTLELLRFKVAPKEELVDYLKSVNYMRPLDDKNQGELYAIIKQMIEDGMPEDIKTKN